MKIYTRTGDTGTTSLVGGKRVSKASERLESYGTVDELNSWLGLLAAGTQTDASSAVLLHTVQNKLFNIGAYLATDNSDNPSLEAQNLSDADVKLLEDEIDRLNSHLKPQRAFILPGGCDAAAQANVARTVCRRAERRIIALTRVAAVDPRVITYVNRLSDYLFTLARYLNHLTSTPEIEWQP